MYMFVSRVVRLVQCTVMMIFINIEKELMYKCFYMY